LLDGGIVEPEEGSHGDFDQALTDVLTVSVGLDSGVGQGEIAEIELPPAAEEPGPAGIVERVVERVVAPGLPPIETEVEGYLIGLELPPLPAQRRRAASLLEQGQTLSEDQSLPQAERKA
jgi:hypothetical protein